MMSYLTKLLEFSTFHSKGALIDNGPVFDVAKMMTAVAE